MSISVANLFLRARVLGFIFLSSLLFVNTSVAAQLCADVYSNYQTLTLSALKQRAIEKSDKIPQSTFTTPRKEVEVSKYWVGTKGPKLMQELLPEGMTYLNQALLQANEVGLVKTGHGQMVHLRATVKGVGTNMGVNVGGLFDNMNRSVKSVVREDAKAVVVFIHGGGTKTTGHHVGISLMNYLHPYKVDVVSLDMPWHAQGPRVSFESVKDSMELIREYIKKYISPSGKPVILAGHSMGGVVSDIYMRLYPNDNLVRAVIPLSTVADALPGGTPAARQARENEINQANLNNPNIPASERDLSSTLARQNKISPVCGMFCSVLMTGVDWKAPAHNGRDYLPALYIIGRGDGLYQGYEKSFHQALQPLENVTLKVYEPRRDIRDRDGSLPTTEVGHLIFDHRPHVEFAPEVSLDVRRKVIAGSIKEAEFNQLRQQGLIKVDPEFNFKDLSDPETHVLMRNFIGRVIKEDLSVKHKISGPILSSVIQAWANNLAFREFATSYIYQYHRASSKTAQLGSELQGVIKRMRELQSKQKKETLNKEDQAELDLLLARQQAIKQLLSGEAIANNENLGAYRELQKQHQDLMDNQVAPNLHQRRETRIKFEEAKNESGRHERMLQSLEGLLTSPALDKARNQREQVFEELMTQDGVVRDLTERYLFNSYSNGRFKKDLFETMPPETLAAFEKYESLSNRYQEVLAEFNTVLISEAYAGSLRLQKGAFEQALEVLPHNIEKPRTAAELEKLVAISSKELERLHLEAQKLGKELEVLEETGAQLSTRLFHLEEQKAKLAGEEYFVLERYSIEGLLNQSLQQAKANGDNMNNILQRIWAEWQKVWAERTGESADSLY